MRTIASVVVSALVAFGCSHHDPTGGTDAGACDPADPTCGTPTNPVVIQCPGCATFPPLGTGAPPACTGTAVDPQLVYPPDQVLLPPNMNVIEVHFMPGANNTLFEIDFENAGTDVRLETMCNSDHQHARHRDRRLRVHARSRRTGTTSRRTTAAAIR